MGFIAANGVSWEIQKAFKEISFQRGLSGDSCAFKKVSEKYSVSSKEFRKSLRAYQDFAFG